MTNRQIFIHSLVIDMPNYALYEEKKAFKNYFNEYTKKNQTTLAKSKKILNNIFRWFLNWMNDNDEFYGQKYKYLFIARYQIRYNKE